MASHKYELNTQLLLLFLLVLLQLTCCFGEPKINTTLGLVRGIQDTSEPGKPVNVFYGIPFAEPPINGNRFMPPVVKKPWEGTFNATTKPNSCYGTIDTVFGDFSGSTMWNPITDLSEDCLYLNVWIPESPTSSAPMAILVWIFGGGFWSGSSMLDVYDATKLASMNDVIVVSLNYRIGPLGFLYTGSEDGGAPGNAGLLDQSMALEWVYKNAESLGGNKSKILIFGESAGATSVGLHLFSKKSQGYYTRAMMMSGSPLVRWGIMDRDFAIKRAHDLAMYLNCTTTTTKKMMDCLRNEKAGEINDAQWLMSSLTGTYFELPFAPVVDGNFLIDTPLNLLERNEFKKTSIMTGVVHDEGTYWLLYGFNGKYFFKDDTHKLNESSLDALIEPLLAPFNLHNNNLVKEMTRVQYVDSMPPSERTENFYADVADDIPGDIIFKCPVIDFSESYSKADGSKVFQYSFEHRLSNSKWPEWFGVAHGYEIEAFFGIPFLKIGDYNDKDREISKTSMKLLTEFAKEGNPGDMWPSYTSENKEYLQVTTEEFKTNTGLRHRECTFWSKRVPLMLADDKTNKCEPVSVSEKTTTIEHVTKPMSTSKRQSEKTNAIEPEIEPTSTSKPHSEKTTTLKPTTNMISKPQAQTENPKSENISEPKRNTNVEPSGHQNDQAGENDKKPTILPTNPSTTSKKLTDENDEDQTILNCPAPKKSPVRGVLRSVMDTINAFDKDRFIELVDEVITFVQKKNKSRAKDQGC